MNYDLERASTAPKQRGARAYFGVPALDELLPDGMSPNTQIMVTGETGVGKSVLAAQFLHEGLLVGDRCLYVACDEAPDVMRQSLARLRIGTLAYEELGQLRFLDAYSRDRSTEQRFVPDPRNLDEYFAYERQLVDGLPPGRVRLCVDSISTLFGTLERNAVLEFNRNRLRSLSSRSVLTLDNYVVGLLDDQTMAGLSHAYPLMAKLGYVEADAGVQRFLQLGKLRSGMFSGRRQLFRIDSRIGIVAQR